MAYELSDMIDKITSYNRVIKEHGFALKGGGVKAWSNRHTNGAGTYHIDVRASEWTIYTADDQEVATGKNADSLDSQLAMMSQLH